MKKLEQKATPANQNGEENAKPTLTVVTGANDQDTTSEQTQNPQPTVKNEAKIIPLTYEQRKDAIEALHRKNVKLDRVKEDFLKLKEFEIELKEEPENTETEYFTGCSISVSDDKGHRYGVKNPRLVHAVVALLKSMYEAKIVELEGEIVWPFPVAA
ncbi:hypothetical protein [Chitinophaga defluvii]|uniref:Uncharacterized protein n=1 Tax=Chitinophaga defluvii TaxID=3163343 RepID=A0ABV2TEC8_9BACT